MPRTIGENLKSKYNEAVTTISDQLIDFIKEEEKNGMTVELDLNKNGRDIIKTSFPDNPSAPKNGNNTSDEFNIYLKAFNDAGDLIKTKYPELPYWASSRMVLDIEKDLIDEFDLI